MYHRLGPRVASQAIEEAAKEAKEKERELMTGNPLVSIAGAGADLSFNMKRR